MSVPHDRLDMMRAGYHLSATDRRCKSCDAPIEWWITTNGKSMPFNAPATDHPDTEEAVVHWATCPQAKQHKGTGKPATAPPGNDAKGRMRRVEELAVSMGALLVLVITDEGHTWFAKNGQHPEDVRQDLITAANSIRREMDGGR